MAVYEGARPRTIVLPRRPRIAEGPALGRRRARTAVRSGRRSRRLGTVLTGVVVTFLLAFFWLSQDVRVNSYSDVESSIIFSHVNIGRHCRIRRAIIDRDVHIPEGTVIGYDQVEDKRRYFVTPSGLTIVTRDASLFENPVDPEFLERY